MEAPIMQSPNQISELRVALTIDDFEQAIRLYRDGLGLPPVQEWLTPEGRGMVLAAGRATLELIDRYQAALIDQVEAGERVAGPVRLAFQVQDAQAAADTAQAASARLIHPPVLKPWGHCNVRLAAPDGMQLTFFQILDDEPGTGSAG
jgi:catechol 2,3-dioxygenase-like lactoylglutathione lyase family enzyme